VPDEITSGRLDILGTRVRPVTADGRDVAPDLLDTQVDRVGPEGQELFADARSGEAGKVEPLDQVTRTAELGLGGPTLLSLATTVPGHAAI
jgi:hypothetical protein